MIDYRRYHDLTERLAVFSAHGGQHLRGDREDLQIADGEPVYFGAEQERARIVGPLAISGPRSIGDGDGASFGLVLEGPATVVLTTERLIIMASDGASQLGPVAAAEVHTFVLPWDLLDAVSMPAKATLGDRVAGGRTIQLVATGLTANVSVAPLKKVLIDDQERRLSDDEVMSLIVRTAVEHRLSVSPANDHQRLRAMSEGRYQFEGGERVAYITDPDETDVPAHLVGRLVDDDETSAAGLQAGGPLPPPPATEDELAPEVVLPPMPVVAPRFEGMLDGRPVLVAFDQERALLSIDDADADRPTVSIPIDDRTVAFEIDESIVRSGRWLVSFEPDQRHAARQLVDSVNSVISGRERIVKDVDATDAHGREVRLSVDWTDRPPTVLVVAPSTGGMTRFDVPPASKCVLEGGRLDLNGRVFQVADSDSAARFLEELAGSGPPETSAPRSAPPRRVERTMARDHRLGVVASGASSARGGPQYVGSAPVGNVWTVRHFVDAACYVIFGITMFVIGAGWGILVGILAILYGVKIAAMGGSYWVSSLVYGVVFIAVLYALGSA